MEVKVDHEINTGDAVITSESVVWGQNGTRVFVDGIQLTPEPSQALKDHSPHVFT